MLQLTPLSKAKAKVMLLESCITLLDWCHNWEHHSRGVIYDRNMFILQPLDLILLNFLWVNSCILFVRCSVHCGSDKHSNLLPYSISYDRKSFYTTSPGFSHLIWKKMCTLMKRSNLQKASSNLLQFFDRIGSWPRSIPRSKFTKFYAGTFQRNVYITFGVIRYKV